MVSTKMNVRFSHRPAFDISGIVIFPLPYTIALGGVATGSINAQLAPNTTGIANNKGFSPKPIATEANIGKNAAVEAVLLVISVKKTISVITVTIMSKIGQVFKAPIPVPIQLAKPVPLIADAMLKPPPNNKRTPHGSFTVSDHTSKAELSILSAGIIKNNAAAP